MIEAGAFDGDIYLNCLFSQDQSNVADLIRYSCISSDFCAPLSGCPTQMQYSFHDNTVKGSMVANDANNFHSFDAYLKNGATVIDNHLLLVSERQQFMEINDFTIATRELTLSFWFNAPPNNEGTFCQFFSDEDGLFRIILNNGNIAFGSTIPPVQINGFRANEWTHVAFVQSIKNQDDDHTPRCTWSTFLNGNIKGSTLANCVMNGHNTLNYIGASTIYNIMTYYFNGSIREFRVYNRALQLSDIESLYLSTYPTFTPTTEPTPDPTFQPSFNPSTTPTFTPTTLPSTAPSFSPSKMPTLAPTVLPTPDPTNTPTTFTPSMAPSYLPTATPTSPSAIPTFIPTSIGGVVSASPLSNLAIAGIVVAGFVFIAALFALTYIFLRPKNTFMNNLRIKKQIETLKYLAAKPNNMKSAVQPTECDEKNAELLKQLEILLIDGEKWKQGKHDESTMHDDLCFVELWRDPLISSAPICTDTMCADCNPALRCPLNSNAPIRTDGIPKLCMKNIGTLMCTDCQPAKPVTRDTMPEKYNYERARMEIDRNLHDFKPENAVKRGLTVGFLVEFCRKFDLWKTPTWQVRRDYIIPMTKNDRCRFVDLLAVKESDVVGVAEIFISFSNATLFGDLITAIRDAADDQCRVWIDIFAVMQWPSLKSDLNFDQVIKSCRIFLSVCPSVPAVGNQKKLFGVIELEPEDRKMIPFYRVWCLFEIYHAASIQQKQDNDKIFVGGVNASDIETEAPPSPPTILFKTGHCQRSSNGSYSFTVNRKMLADLNDYIDINKADATIDADKIWIFRQINTGYSDNDGVKKLNKLVNDVVKTAKILDSDPILEAAFVSGETIALNFIRNKPELYILNMYRCGFFHLLSTMMNVNSATEIQISIFNRLEDRVEVYRIDYNGSSLNYVLFLEKFQTKNCCMKEGSFLIARILGDDAVDVGVFVVKSSMKKWIID